MAGIVTPGLEGRIATQLPAAAARGRADPEQEAELADAVGMALLVVPDKLSPPC